jgi:hypothetical protein
MWFTDDYSDSDSNTYYNADTASYSHSSASPVASPTPDAAMKNTVSVFRDR